MRRKIIIGTSVLILLIMGYKVYDRFFYTRELLIIKGTKLYHRDDCEFIKKSSADKIIFFNDISETAKLEFRPCNTCNPPNVTKKLIADKARRQEEDKPRRQEEDKPRREAEELVKRKFSDSEWDEYNKWLVQFKKDLNAGKIDKDKIGEYDEYRILLGLFPAHTYKKAADIPTWITSSKYYKTHW